MIREQSILQRILLMSISQKGLFNKYTFKRMNVSKSRDHLTSKPKQSMWIFIFLIACICFTQTMCQDTLLQRNIPRGQQQQMYYLIKQINLRQQGGVVGTFTSLQYTTFDETSMLLVTQNSRVIIFICSQNFTNCIKAPTIELREHTSILTSSLSNDRTILVLGCSDGNLYVYKSASLQKGVYQLKGVISDSKDAIKTSRMDPQGFHLFAGGAQKVARYYYFDTRQPNLYHLNQTFTQVPSQIITVSNLQVTQLLSYFFIAHFDGVKVYLFNMNSGQYLFVQEIKVSNLAVIATPVSIANAENGVLAIGTHNGVVILYQPNQYTNKLSQVQQLKEQKFGDIISISFSQDGNYLIIGNHNQQTYIYKKTIQSKGNYTWQMFETLKFSNDPSNFMKVVKFKPDGKYLVTGSDDLFLRAFAFGKCPSGTSFDNYGRCLQISYWWIYVSVALVFICLLIIAIVIYKKKVLIPQESKMPIMQYE